MYTTTNGTRWAHTGHVSCYMPQTPHAAVAPAPQHLWVGTVRSEQPQASQKRMCSRFPLPFQSPRARLPGPTSSFGPMFRPPLQRAPILHSHGGSLVGLSPVLLRITRPSQSAPSDMRLHGACMGDGDGHMSHRTWHMHDKRTQPTKVATRSLSRSSSSNGP